MAPPEAITLIWSAPSLSCSLAARLTASAPSQTTERMPAVGQKISGGCVSVVLRQSPCPPVCESGRSLTSSRGPWTIPRSTAALKLQSVPPASLTVVKPSWMVSSRILAIIRATRLEGCSLCWSRTLTSTAPMWTWASVSPGMSVIPAQSMTLSYPPVGPGSPKGTSLILSPSTTTDARSRGSFPAQSTRKALAKSVVPVTLRYTPRERGLPDAYSTRSPGLPQLRLVLTTLSGTSAPCYSLRV